MLRKLFTLIATVSLIACIASAVLWVRTRSSDIRWQTDHGGRVYFVRIVMGRFTMFWMEGRSTPGGAIIGPTNGKWITTALTHTETTYGFGLSHSDWSDPKWASQLALEFPMWFATAVFALLPLLWLMTLRRRKSSGACPRCGYNLTGNTSGKCPECGTVVPLSLGAIES